MSTHTLRTASIYIVIWSLIFGVIWIGMTGALDHRENPNRTVSAAHGQHALILKRNLDGHYLVDGTINGVPVRFMLDTGATRVSIPGPLARRIGLKPGKLGYASTANGTVVVYDTIISDLTFGPFYFSDVSANMGDGMEGNHVLLGMNVLKRLLMIQHGGNLELRLE